MRIRFTKLDDERHELEIQRENAASERVACETRSQLLHDLLHLAVESEARLADGFWGRLASGVTLAEMNTATVDLETIEELVGALHGATKRRPSAEIVAGMQRYAQALDRTLPAWLTEDFVAAVEERLRRYVGHWRATPYGSSMELEWPSGEASSTELSASTPSQSPRARPRAAARRRP